MPGIKKAEEEVDRWAQPLEIRPQLVDIPFDLDPAKEVYLLEETHDRLRNQINPVLQEIQETSEELTRLREYQKKP